MLDVFGEGGMSSVKKTAPELPQAVVQRCPYGLLFIPANGQVLELLPGLEELGRVSCFVEYSVTPYPTLWERGTVRITPLNTSPRLTEEKAAFRPMVFFTCILGL